MVQNKLFNQHLRSYATYLGLKELQDFIQSLWEEGYQCPREIDISFLINKGHYISNIDIVI